MRVLVFDAVFGSRVCKECWVPSLWLVGGSWSSPLIGCHWPLTCVRDQAALAGGSDNQSWSEYSVQSLTPIPAQLRVSALSCSDSALSCVLKASSLTASCLWLTVSGEKECSAEGSDFAGSGCGVTPHSKLYRSQIGEGSFFIFQYIEI